MPFWVYLICSLLISYIVGAIPFALIIGKLFYKTDVREYGSKNLGTTNVGRVLGKKAAIFVLLFDATKGGGIALGLYLLSFPIIGTFDYSLAIYLACGIAACLGHCYSPFASFKGGKAVATLFGFLAFTNIKLFVIFLLIFIIIALSTRIVSMASLCASLGVTLSSLIPYVRDNNFYLDNKIYYLYTTLTLGLITILLIVRHIPNIKRLLNKTEAKFSFKK